jgi:cytoskeletal protein RodZ
METLGKYLKREREFRNISLKEMAKNTKVREHLLRAIEEDRYDSLPSPTYVRGFLLAYARYIGLDPHEALFRYEGALKALPLPSEEGSFERRVVWKEKRLWVLGGAVLAGLIAFYFLILSPSKPPVAPVSVKPESARPEVERTVPPSPQIEEKSVTPEEKPFKVQLKAVEKTWVRMWVDDQPEREMTLQPGETTSHQAVKRIEMRVGNAGGLDLILDGRDLGRFGESGEVVTLILTSQGVEVKRSEKEKVP